MSGSASSTCSPCLLYTSLGAYVLPFALLIFAAGLFLRDRAPLNARTLLGGSLILLGVLADVYKRQRLWSILSSMTMDVRR